MVEGQKLSIPVPFRAVPTPTISWHKSGKELKAGDRTTMKSDYTSALLEITNAVHADAGVYTITLENKLGSTTGTVNVKVIGKYLFSFLLTDSYIQFIVLNQCKEHSF